MVEKEFYVIEPDEYPRLMIKKRYPYNRIIQLLLEGHEIFIEMNRKNAWYFKQELQKRTSLPIESYPAQYKNMRGYVFRISLVRKLLDEFSQPSKSAGDTKEETNL